MRFDEFHGDLASPVRLHQVFFSVVTCGNWDLPSGNLT